MTDAHYHRGGVTWLSLQGREYRFLGCHPWDADSASLDEVLSTLRMRLTADSSVGVGEIGLDRLRERAVSDGQRALFSAQLSLAAELHRPVVLHGAKCWGEVVKAVQPFAGDIPAFLFHGFSRSEGLLPAIFALNGYVSVGRAILNDHAVNYRTFVSRLPHARLLVETDAVDADEQVRAETLNAVFGKVAALTGVSEAQLDANAAALLGD